MIKSFDGEYRWLSNFWPCQIYAYPSVEHAYQAMKTLNHDERKRIMNAPTASIAKRLGRKVTIRSDWNDIKLDVMLACVHAKFQHPELAAKLKTTGDQELVEGNHWHDTYWGVCNDIGENHLGKILMKVRSEL